MTPPPARAALYVADPGLSRAGGHNAGALATLGAAARGMPCRFFGHRHPDAELQALAARLGVALEPWFEMELYAGYQRNWTLDEAEPYVSALARDYRGLLDRLEAGGAGTVLHHTMDWPHLWALARALAARPGGNLRHAVFLMFNPGIDDAGTVRDARGHLGYRTALAPLLGSRGVRAFAACGELSDAYGRAFGQPAPQVHPCFFFDTAPPLRARQPGGPVLLYAGDAKLEKGFGDLPALARAFLRHGNAGERFVAHYNLLEADALRRPAEELARIAREDARLTLLPRFMSQDELGGLFGDAGCVVFNYDPAVYAHQTSGLLWQACSAGTPAIVLGESWLLREARRINAQVSGFANFAALERELRSKGGVQFAPAPIDELYRRKLFRPLGEFLRAELGLG